MLEILLGLGKTVIDKVLPDQESKQKAQAKLLQMAQEGELRDLEARMSAITAEATSSDPWTSRARPTFMYVFYFILLSLVVFAPLVGVVFPSQMEVFFANVARGFIAVPEELWWTFTAGYLGYSSLRSYEKKKGVAK